jgi:hypothetical protein
MSDSNLFGDEHRKIESRPPLGEDLLPPVEQPSAKFIIQLFVVPALIVLLIVGLWLSFNWLVRRTALGPDSLIAGIEEGPSVARWQRASELANLLQDKRYASLKQDPKAAANLARILDREMERAKEVKQSQEQATLRYFLARVLGEFQVNEGLESLLRAAETKGDEGDELVRHGALMAIAVRAYNMHQLDPPQQLAHPDLEPTLMRLATDEVPRIRYETAYALGQIASPTALERLETMVDDPDPDTRYNAAVALAHHGNAKSVDTLAEMLDTEELMGLSGEQNDADRQTKRTILIGSAINAAHALAKENPEADLSPVVQALQRIANADKATLRKAHIESHLAMDAERSLEKLRAGK